MNFETHLKFKAGNVDISLNSVDLKAILENGGLTKIMGEFSQFLAEMKIDTRKPDIPETAPPQIPTLDQAAAHAISELDRVKQKLEEGLKEFRELGEKKT